MDRNKNMAPPSKSIRSKPLSTASTASTSRKVLPSKDKHETGVRVNKNVNSNGDGGTTTCKTDNALPDYDALYRQIAYGKFLRTMLEDCLVEEKIEKEETQMDIQMTQLADRVQKTVHQLDKTNRRLKDIKFVVEQKRLIDLKRQDSNTFYNITDNSNVENVLDNLKLTEEACLDKLETRNVDFGYNSQSGHKQLLDAVNDAIDGMEQIKKNSNLDINKFKEYEKSHKSLDKLEKNKCDMESLKSEFEIKFPKFSEKLLKDISEKISSVMDDNDNNNKDTD